MFNLEKDHSPSFFPGCKPSDTALKPAQLSQIVQIDAAVFVCVSWLTFKDDTAVRQWAAWLLQNAWPEATLGPQARVEAIVGHHRLNQTTRTNMHELLNYIMNQAGLNAQQYRIEFLEIQMKPPSKLVWAVTAVFR